MLPRNALVIGSSGALGRSVVASLLAKKWNVFGADVITPTSTSQITFGSVGGSSSIECITKDLQALVKDTPLNLVINVAGGWAGGSIDSADVAAATELMLRQSLFTSVAAGHVFAKQGAANSLLIFTGALAAAEPCPGMIAYGTAKSAVHFLTKSIAADAAKLPKNSAVVAILPVTLDTPGNRQGMPGADTSSWTPLTDIADELAAWGDGLNRPRSGSFVAIHTEAHKTQFNVLPS